jgi:hypothetical protein
MSARAAAFAALRLALAPGQDQHYGAAAVPFTCPDLPR